MLWWIAGGAAIAAKVDVAVLGRVGAPAREFVHEQVVADLGMPTVGIEVGAAVQRQHDTWGVRPSLAVEGWMRRWRDLALGTPYAREVGIRFEPRLAGRWIFARDRMWTRGRHIVPTLEAAVGAAFVVFSEADRGFWAASPIVAVRPALHIGAYEPWFLAVDLRAGWPRVLETCDDTRAYCPQVRLDPGGTSIGVLLGKTL